MRKMNKVNIKVLGRRNSLNYRKVVVLGFLVSFFGMAKITESKEMYLCSGIRTCGVMIWRGSVRL